MDYVEWVERVFDAVVELDDGGMGVVPQAAVAARLGFGAPTWEEYASHRDPRLEGLMQALDELDLVGVSSPFTSHLQVGAQARDIAHVGFRQAVWPLAFSSVLDPAAERLLRVVADRCDRRGDDHAWLATVDLMDAWSAAGNVAPDDYTAGMRARAQAGALHNKGLVSGRGAGQNPPVRPTLLGSVRATRANDLEWQDRLAALVADWETTSVEFKRELDLATDEGKRRLVRSALALANTKASGRRFLVVGYDPKSHAFAQSVEPSVTADRIEDVLAASADPVPETRYRTVGVPGGMVGVVEIVRNPEHLPYRARRAMRGVPAGAILVRHGSHVETPTTREEQDLVREGRLARGEAVEAEAEADEE